MHEGGRRLAVVGGSTVPLDERKGPQPVSSLWELYFAHSSFGAYRRHTQHNVRRTAALCAVLRLGEFPAPGDVAIWVSRLRELPGRRGARMSSRTVGLHRDNLHKMFAWAQACGKGWTQDLGNPVNRNLCPFRREAPLRVALRSVDDVWPFLLATAGEGKGADVARRRAFLGVMRYLGLRRGEALSLRACNVRLDGGGMAVEVTHQRDPDSFVLLPTKTPRAVRTLPVRAELFDLLTAVLKLPTARVRVGLGGCDGEREVPFLFPFRTIDLNAMMLGLRGASRDDFPPGDAWHVFRHTVAVELSRKGAPIEEISEWLGHVSIAHTQNYMRTLVGKRVSARMLDYFGEERAGMKKRGRPPSEEKAAPVRKHRSGLPSSPSSAVKRVAKPTPKHRKEQP
jgi:integrase